ncbi:MAG: hypothetical protein ABI208_09750 [Ginsengibacter sp.]|jgi:hypothetical protein
MPDDIDDHIKKIHGKLQILLKRYADLEKKNKKLSIDNEILQNNRFQMEEKISMMEQQLFILKASAAKLEGEEKRSFEKSINQYIKTIEKTIATITH